mmetsp:Transcript_101135/g.324890  ORF Transcript_101135/g.324890 Transcript_101135/m.324890 type:complete len:457 (-) Transcript_101135:121-1491(-)
MLGLLGIARAALLARLAVLVVAALVVKLSEERELSGGEFVDLHLTDHVPVSPRHKPLSHRGGRDARPHVNDKVDVRSAVHVVAGPILLGILLPAGHHIHADVQRQGAVQVSRRGNGIRSALVIQDYLGHSLRGSHQPPMHLRGRGQHLDNTAVGEGVAGHDGAAWAWNAWRNRHRGEASRSHPSLPNALGAHGAGNNCPAAAGALAAALSFSPSTRRAVAGIASPPTAAASATASNSRWLLGSTGAVGGRGLRRTGHHLAGLAGEGTIICSGSLGNHLPTVLRRKPPALATSSAATAAHASVAGIGAKIGGFTRGTVAVTARAQRPSGRCSCLRCLAIASSFGGSSCLAGTRGLQQLSHRVCSRENGASSVRRSNHLVGGAHIPRKGQVGDARSHLCGSLTDRRCHRPPDFTATEAAGRFLLLTRCGEAGWGPRSAGRAEPQEPADGAGESTATTV